MAFSVNFNKPPVSNEAIEKAVRERREALEAQRALDFADDMAACDVVVSNGKRKLKELRKAADDFHKEFKKLEQEFDSITDFVDTLNKLSIKPYLGSVILKGDYEKD